MTRILVTGCTGFIGSHLVKKLVELGYDVYGLIKHISRGDLQRLASVLDRLKLVQGDLTSYHSVKSAVQSVCPHIIVHLGAVTPVRLSFEDPFPYIYVNYLGTVNLIHSILDNAPKSRLILASTAEVYGWQDNDIIKEDRPLRPASPYAASKAAADLYTQMAMRVYGLKSTILRPNNTYGRVDERGYFVEYVITTMLEGKTVYVGTPDSVRDYMFVDDHINAYILCLENQNVDGYIFNVSPGNPVTNKNLVGILVNLLDFKGKIMYGSYPPGYPQRRTDFDPSNFTLDSSVIRKVLGWRPAFSLEEGLRTTIELWRHRS